MGRIGRRTLTTLVWKIAAVGGLAAGAGVALMVSCSRSPQTPAASPVTVKAELRSWVVLGRGRHLYLEIEAPPPHEDLSGRVEYTMISLRSDYDSSADQSVAPRVGRFRGYGNLRPPNFGPPPDNRLEATYVLTLDQARCIQADRVFEEAYVLVGPNSNAGLRTVMEGCGVPVPERVKAAGGLLGEFPGIEFSVGAEVPREGWVTLGIRR